MSSLFHTGFLKIDGVLEANGESKKGATSVNHIVQIFFGGVPKDSQLPPRMPVSKNYVYVKRISVAGLL